MRKIKISAIIAATVIWTLFTGTVLPAAEYPQKPVQILVGFPPGGAADLSTRALVEAAKPFFPKPFIVVNKPGGGSVLATNEMVQSAPNGYTLCNVLIASLTSSPHLESGLPYKGPEDVQPVISVINSQNTITVKADAPWKTMTDLIDYAKANPGKLRIGNAGVGTPTHLHYLSLKLAGVPMSEVPFAGGPQAIMALLGGHIEGASVNVTNVLPHIRAGKLKILALFTEERVNDVPELQGVPTLKELGYGNTITEGAGYAICAPRGTPPKIIDILHEGLLKAEKSEPFQKFGRDNVLALELKGPDELKREFERSYTFYRDFIKKTGLKMTPQK